MPATPTPPVPAAETPAVLPEVPEDLSAVPSDDLRSLHATLEEAYQARRAEATVENLADLRTLREHQATIAAEFVRRDAEQAQLESDLAALDGEATELPAPAGPDDEPDEGEGDPAEGAPTATAPAQTTRAASTVPAADVLANRTPQARAQQRPVPDRPQVAYVAAAGQSRVQVGQPIAGEQLLAAYMDAHNARGEQDKPQTVVASLPALPGPLLGDGGLRENDRLIRETLTAFNEWRANGADPAARTAAICGPFDIIREIPICSDATDDFSGIFPSRAAGRWGYQYTPPADLSTVASGVAEWTDDLQDDVDADVEATWKPVVDVTCAEPVSVVLEEITGGVRVPTNIAMSSPERLAEVLGLIQAQLTQVKIAKLLGKLDAQSIHWSDSTVDYGAFPDAVNAILRVLERIPYPNRVNPGNYVVAVPPGFIEAVVGDDINRAAVDKAMGIADAIAEIKRLTGVSRVIQLRDVQKGEAAPFAALPADGGANAVLPAMPTLFRLEIFDPGSWLYSTSGEQNNGVETSPELARQNRKQWFSTEWVSLQRVGCARSARLDLTVCANGSRAAGIAPIACPMT